MGALLLTAIAMAVILPHQTLVSRLFSTRPHFLTALLRDFLQLSLPFTVIMVWRWREMCAIIRKNWPLALFAVVTLYQPHSYFFHTSPDNSLRIGMQGVWVLNLMACFVIIDRLQQSPDNLFRLSALICPVLWVVMRAFEQYGLLAGGELWAARILVAGLLALTCFPTPPARQEGHPS